MRYVEVCGRFFYIVDQIKKIEITKQQTNALQLLLQSGGMPKKS